MSEESSTETVLGSRYRIERELGQGGMGRVGCSPAVADIDVGDDAATGSVSR